MMKAKHLTEAAVGNMGAGGAVLICVFLLHFEGPLTVSRTGFLKGKFSISDQSLSADCYEQKHESFQCASR